MTRALDSMAEKGFQDPATVRSEVVNLYVTRQEYIEMYYGEAGRLNQPTDAALADAVTRAENRFHELMQILGEEPAPGPERIEDNADELQSQLDQVLREAARAEVPMTIPGRAREEGDQDDDPAEAPEAVLGDPGSVGVPTPAIGEARTSEIRSILATLKEARESYRAGAAKAALRGVEDAYLEGFEPLEARLPGERVRRVERLFHLSLRPRVARGAPVTEVDESFQAVRGELVAADAELTRGSSFWFGTLNSFVIIVREGLEAVLLLGAILAYLSRTGAESQHRRQIWAGVGLAVVASFATWAVARTLIPIGGANRELLEGVTALLAVGVLIYVSNWLFQKTYIHDWKAYLEEQVGRAVSTGSALIMAGLAFAAVYREGFETVLFYQALLFDVGFGAVLAGFLPGLLLIAAVGLGIIRMGLRLPLKQFFMATNALLVYLAFVLLGKGIYNLQEAGLFAPHPLAWVPDHEALRQVLGLYPMAEGLIGQAALMTLIAGTYAYYRLRMRKPSPTHSPEAGGAGHSARTSRAAQA